jgi:nitrogen fixation NifU-like protein
VTDPRALYHATIVAHDRNPHHEGPLPAATHAATADNPLCGDVVTIRFVVANGVIAEAAFEARGCALCRAAASLLADRAIGATTDEVRALAASFAGFVQGEPATGELGELVVFEGVRAFKSRRACARLAFDAAEQALQHGPLQSS